MFLKYDYFDAFVLMMENCCIALELMKKSLMEYNRNKLKENVDEISKLVGQTEKEKQILIDNLDREFITPIEKTDIVEIAQRIVRLTYYIEDGMNMLCSCDLVPIRNDVLLLVQINQNCCLKLKEVVKELRNFRKSKALIKDLALFYKLLKNGRRSYNQTLYKSYMVYSELKKIFDCFIDIAFILEGVIINNS
ncbi:MAG: hypothetical protein GX076_08830 [Clostridiales bacterium]|nr:hypothetical protein [Clostridiales bacterium]